MINPKDLTTSTQNTDKRIETIHKENSLLFVKSLDEEKKPYSLEIS